MIDAGIEVTLTSRDDVVRIADMGPYYIWLRPGEVATSEELAAIHRNELSQEQMHSLAQRVQGARDQLLAAETSRRPS